MRTQTKTSERRTTRGRPNGNARRNPMTMRSTKGRTMPPKRASDEDDEDIEEEEDLDLDLDAGQDVRETRGGTRGGKQSSRTVSGRRAAVPIAESRGRSKTRASTKGKATKARPTKAGKTATTRKTTTGKASANGGARTNGRARTTGQAKRRRRTGGGFAGTKRQAAH
jgi:hypothetical protein